MTRMEGVIGDIEDLHTRIDKLEKSVDVLKTLVVRVNEIMTYLKFQECLKIPEEE